MLSYLLHSGCRNNLHFLSTFLLYFSAHAKSDLSSIITLSSSAFLQISVRGGAFLFGERHIQSHLPVKGYMPDVSIKVRISIFFNELHKKSRFHVKGSPPVTTTEFVPDFTTCSTIVSVSTTGCSEGFQANLVSHQAHPTSQPPSLMKYAGFPVW